LAYRAFNFQEDKPVLSSEKGQNCRYLAYPPRRTSIFLEIHYMHSSS